MTELDDLVRASLEAQVRTPPPLSAPADRAIAPGRASTGNGSGSCPPAREYWWFSFHRRLVALSPGTPVGPPTTQSTGSSTGSTARPSAVAGATAGPAGRPVGQRGRLGQPAHRQRYHGAVDRRVRSGGPRVPDCGGWLIVTFGPGTNSLWLLTADGSAHRLLDQVDSLAVGPDGQRFAWLAGGRIHVGHLSAFAVTDDKSTPAPVRGAPIAYTGSAVILGYSETGGGIDHIDVWIPDNGDYVPSWDRTTHVVAVYQPAPDGTLYGLVHGPDGGKSVLSGPAGPGQRSACHPDRVRPSTSDRSDRPGVPGRQVAGARPWWTACPRWRCLTSAGSSIPRRWSSSGWLTARSNG